MIKKLKQEISNKYNRESNWEVLRILAMIMIIMHHFALHSGFSFGDNVTINKLVVDIFSAFGKLGVVLFIIISGYFYDKTEFKIKKIVSLMLKVWIYAILGLMVGIVFQSNNLNFTNVIKSIMPITFGLYWFASCYVLIYIFSPFMKKVIELFNKKELKILITIMVILWSFIAIIPKTKTYNNEFIFLIVIYFIGAFIKKYNVNLLNNKQRLIGIGFCISIMIAIMFIFEFLAIKTPVFNKAIRHFNNLHSPIVLFLAILIFNVFKEIKIPKSKVVNLIASSTFGIYLIHDNIFLREIIWKDIFNVSNYAQSTWFIFYSLAVVSIVFVVSSIIELIMQNLVQTRLMKLLYKIVEKIKETKIAKKVKGYITKIYLS